MPREYSVGYKKPPVEYRFKKGNLAARRKTSRKDKVPDLVSHLNSIAPLTRTEAASVSRCTLSRPPCSLWLERR